MSYMFQDVGDFHQDLSSWDVSQVTDHENFLYNSGENNIEPLWVQ